MIFNTSFNLGGEALVETIEDAIDTCNRSEINWLYVPEDQNIHIPEYLFKIKKLEDVNVNHNAEG
jgi:predicted NodU family carbamoyl transferase